MNEVANLAEHGHHSSNLYEGIDFCELGPVRKWL